MASCSARPVSSACSPHMRGHRPRRSSTPSRARSASSDEDPPGTTRPSSPSASAETRRSMTVFELHGASLLDVLGDELDRLHDAMDAPITARRPWLVAWTKAYPEYEPWAIGVRSSDGELCGVALL